MSQHNPIQMIQEMEESLLKPETRKSIPKLQKLIAEDFIEYGSSGIIYNKQDLLDSLHEEEPKDYLAENFKVKELSPTILLITYKITIAPRCSLRSSIWQYKNNRWQMIFHQGTPC